MVYNCVLVGYDGSVASKKAVNKALDLAKRIGSRLLVVTVVPRPWLLLGELMAPIPVDMGEAVSSVKQSLEKLVKELKSISGYDDIDALVVEGEPAESLAETAQEKGCELIVVGRRGASGVERLLIGSVSSRLVSIARGVDVLVVES